MAVDWRLSSTLAIFEHQPMPANRGSPGNRRPFGDFPEAEPRPGQAEKGFRRPEDGERPILARSRMENLYPHHITSSAPSLGSAAIIG